MQRRNGATQKVVAALSGGVDSAVSAALLKEAGHEVIGVFVRVWQPDFIPCTVEEDRMEAMRVAAFLDIPFETVDFSDAYKREVVDYMVEEYSAGRTPNPDVMCNRSVKFGALWEWASERGYDAIATGHYASVEQKEAQYELHAGADAQKDQSYFLWTLTEDDLAHIRFPVGDKQKAEVRALAETFGLPNASRKDSQGLCFLGKLDVKEFLRHFITTVPGAVLDESGKIIGTHDGAALYTLGERRGFVVPARSPHEMPLYVVGKDIETNTLVVTDAPQKSAVTEHWCARLEQMRWVGEAPRKNGAYQARYRYRQPLQSCRVDNDLVHFDEPQPALPPGQSLVVYDGTRVVGGGNIA